MNFLDRRTIRKYTSKQISQDEIDRIMEVALVSPSGCNRRPYHYVLVDDKSLLEKLSMAKFAGGTMIKEASHAIVVIGDKSISDLWDVDCSVSTILIQEKAWELGIGSCWVHMKDQVDAQDNSSEEIIRELLAIPEQYGVLSVVALGYSDEIRPAYTKEDMDFGKVHKNRF